MSTVSNTFLHGKLYIHEAYGLSFVPTLIQGFSGHKFNLKSEADLKAAAVAMNGPVEGDGKRIVVINFKQPVIKFTDAWYGWLGTQTYIRILTELLNDDTVLGVVMDMDSGGGQVYGTPEFYDFITQFTAKKPLVVYAGGYLCSGAYYIAAPSSWIVANKRADAIGSIGAYTVLMDFNGMWQKFGAKVHTIYSSLSDEKNKAHRDVMSEKDKDYKQYITLELDPIVEDFIQDMKAVRPQIKEEAFKGGVWSGKDSIDMGLADELGTLEMAVQKVYELSKNFNNQSKKKTMSKTSKSFPTIQKIAGIEGEGIPVVKTITGKKGIQVEEEQLEKIETALANGASEVQTQKDAVAAEQAKVTKLEGTVASALKKAGLEAAETTEASIELLANKVVEYGNHPAIKASKPKAEGDSFDDDDNQIVNADDEHNKIYDEA
ncbi:MAG: S49 family peptidase [Flavobacteriales bacterium]|nr:S49 family peptidase [Flavobacteriales bacterium]